MRFMLTLSTLDETEEAPQVGVDAVEVAATGVYRDVHPGGDPVPVLDRAAVVLDVETMGEVLHALNDALEVAGNTRLDHVRETLLAAYDAEADPWRAAIHRSERARAARMHDTEARLHTR